MENKVNAIEEVDSLVKRALKCLDEYAGYTQEQIDYIVAKASVAALDKHGILALHAVEETKRGVFEDKAEFYAAAKRMVGFTTLTRSTPAL